MPLAWEVIFVSTCSMYLFTDRDLHPEQLSKPVVILYP